MVINNLFFGMKAANTNLRISVMKSRRKGTCSSQTADAGEFVQKLGGKIYSSELRCYVMDNKR